MCTLKHYYHEPLSNFNNVKLNVILSSIYYFLDYHFLYDLVNASISKCSRPIEMHVHKLSTLVLKDFFLWLHISSSDDCRISWKYPCREQICFSSVTFPLPLMNSFNKIEDAIFSMQALFLLRLNVPRTALHSWYVPVNARLRLLPKQHKYFAIEHICSLASIRCNAFK